MKAIYPRPGFPASGPRPIQANPVGGGIENTVEMHSEFELLPGMEFGFKGDDDVWLFIDGKLVMDLGACTFPCPIRPISTNSA
jgi:hypothetical protein